MKFWMEMVAVYLLLTGFFGLITGFILMVWIPEYRWERRRYHVIATRIYCVFFPIYPALLWMVEKTCDVFDYIWARTWEKWYCKNPPSKFYEWLNEHPYKDKK